MNVSSRDLRQNLKYYLDKLEEGEELTIIRHSVVVGRLVPAGQSTVRDTEQELRDNKRVKFRRFALYEDPTAVQKLHRDALESTGEYIDDPKLDTDLANPAAIYEAADGEFWVGELNGDLVAMGAFRANLLKPGEAELKRLRVRPKLQGQGVGSKLLELLENRAKAAGFKVMVPDEPVEMAKTFYEKHGYMNNRKTLL